MLQKATITWTKRWLSPFVVVQHLHHKDPFYDQATLNDQLQVLQFLLFVPIQQLQFVALSFKWAEISAQVCKNQNENDPKADVYSILFAVKGFSL